MLQFSRKMCFKRATFCIIQRRVKRRCILLLQIFSFLLRWLLTLVKVHIMLCKFRNGTTKSLILTLKIFIWHGITNFNTEILQGLTTSAAEILHGLVSNAAEILQGLTAQACKNSARLDVQCCRNSAQYDVHSSRNLQAMTSWVKDILCFARFNAAEILSRCFSILKKDKL